MSIAVELAAALAPDKAPAWASCSGEGFPRHGAAFWPETGRRREGMRAAEPPSRVV